MTNIKAIPKFTMKLGITHLYGRDKKTLINSTKNKYWIPGIKCFCKSSMKVVQRAGMIHDTDFKRIILHSFSIYNCSAKTIRFGVCHDSR